jgi:hypothetical protein
MIENEICPCDDCDMKYKCDQYELACGAFSYFVLHGIYDRQMAKVPTGKLFHKIFKEDDKALKNYMKSIKMKEEMGK